MLQQRCRLPVLWVVALQAFDESHSHGAVEKWIFSVNLFAASPARIARQIGLRSPLHQNLAVVFRGLGDKARLVALHARRLANQLRIPRLAHALWLRKLRRGNRQPLASRLALHYSMDAFRAAHVG